MFYTPYYRHIYQAFWSSCHGTEFNSRPMLKNMDTIDRVKLIEPYVIHLAFSAGCFRTFLLRKQNRFSIMVAGFQKTLIFQNFTNIEKISWAGLFENFLRDKFCTDNKIFIFSVSSFTLALYFHQMKTVFSLFSLFFKISFCLFFNLF